MPEADSGWPMLPTETEIYILPNGEIVVADLPAEIAAHLLQVSQLNALESTGDSDNVTNQHDPAKPAESVGPGQDYPTLSLPGAI
jgi:hypothetical protein